MLMRATVVALMYNMSIKDQYFSHKLNLKTTSFLFIKVSCFNQIVFTLLIYHLKLGSLAVSMIRKNTNTRGHT
jgi:hypothetical protein